VTRKCQPLFHLAFSASRNKMARMRIVVMLCSFFCAAAVALAQTTFTPVSNLNQTTGEYTGVWNAQSLAVSFTTGSAATSLFGVSVSMSAGGDAGHFNLSIYSDAGGSPGSSLTILSGNGFPASAGIYTYTNASPLALSANTTYWIVASSPDSTGGDAYEWNLTFNSALDSGSFWTLGVSKYNDGGGWNSSGTGVYQQFSVIVTNPIAPAISIFQPIVLTYPAVGFPFVLQQNSNLATTNWVTATNAILSGVISNQTVFIVPPTGGQMFYRLNLQ
jgi:hypothetical protein